MLVAPHITAGVTLGALLGNPIVVIPAAIASHFLLDMVPHWQETLAPYQPTRKTYIRIPFDLAIGAGVIAVGLMLHPDQAWGIWLGAVFGAGPDFDVITLLYPRLKRGILAKYWDWHCAIQQETSSLWGLVPQVIVVCGGLLAMYV